MAVTISATKTPSVKSPHQKPITKIDGKVGYLHGKPSPTGGKLPKVKVSH